MRRDGLSAFDRTLQSEEKTDVISYLSPEQVAILKSGEAPQQQYDQFKSDVFTLGMLVLELCTLTPCFLVYHNLSINEEVLQDLLLKVAERYSESLYEFIKVMVYTGVKRRPDFFELDELISSSFMELKNRRIA